MRLQALFALLDVKHGRVGLKKRIDKGERIPVTIRGEICGSWGDDDGTSREFDVEVASVIVEE